MKKLLLTQRSDTPHWVGDGFPVRSIFTYNDLGKAISPFLLMDYGGPTNFEASNSKHIKGVGQHPHRGFETVTIVYSGEVEHRDSAGGGGKIGPGDVQWMTAASGLVHEERHGKDFAKNGGRFEMIQLWVNLPAKDKMAKPRYQGIQNADISTVELKENAGTLRVIAGSYLDSKGPAKTFTPINLWDVKLKSGKKSEFKMPAGFTTLVFVLNGKVKLGSGEVLSEAELGVLDRNEELFTLEAEADSTLLILGGEPIEEPMIGYGPFVMNTSDEIRQAFEDFNNGLMGEIGPIEGSS
ncbi:MAG: pirin family protein [Bdellovibrionota bacterium]